MHCFDKQSEKSFISNINRIGGEHFFYDTIEDREQTAENSLSRLESKFSHSYMKLIKTKDLDALNKSDKTLISAFLLTQWYRTKETRERIRDYNKQLKTFLTEHGDLSENLENELNTDNDYIKEIHLPLFREIPNQIAYVLSMKWILMINRTDMPFWSSDSPISLDNFLNPSKFNSYGLYSEGITIHFL